MKKGLVIGLAMVLVFGLATVGMAATTVYNTWTGSGVFTADVYAGDDAETHVWTGGNTFSGEFWAKDFDNNPYSYNVDSFETKIDASVSNGGQITFNTLRTDSYTPMYGQAGQESFADILTDDGSATMVFRSSTNYASMGNFNWGWQANNQFVASGSNFYINHWIQDGDGEGASVGVYNGSGSASVTAMSSEMHSSSFRLGRGGGCFDNANAFGSGSGTFQVLANASNSLSGNGWSSGGGTYSQTIAYTGGFNINNYYVDGD